MDAAILLKGVTKSFGKAKAVENLELAVPRGGLYVLSGRMEPAKPRRSG
jgi:ABC-type multidrug transport system ATPase subunit